MNPLDIKILQEILDREKSPEKMNTAFNDLQEACQILYNIYWDANQVIDGSWEINDDGFKNQINRIKDFFDKVGYKYEEYEPEEEFDDEYDN